MLTKLLIIRLTIMNIYYRLAGYAFFESPLNWLHLSSWYCRDRNLQRYLSACKNLNSSAFVVDRHTEDKKRDYNSSCSCSCSYYMNSCFGLHSGRLHMDSWPIANQIDFFSMHPWAFWFWMPVLCKYFLRHSITNLFHTYFAIVPARYYSTFGAKLEFLSSSFLSLLCPINSICLYG